MDPGDLQPAARLQVPTGSKRPSPSPSEGEADREIKKFRPQRPNDDEGNGPQSNELVFPFADLPYGDFFGDQRETFSSNQDVCGMPFSTTPDSKVNNEGQPAPLTTSNIDYEVDFGNEVATTAMDVDPEAEINLWWREFSHNPHPGFDSHLDRDVLNGAGHPDQILCSEGIGWEGVGSTPMRGTQAHEPPSQTLTMSLPKEHMDVDKKCDACFGVIITTPASSPTQEDATRSIPVNLRPVGNYFILQNKVSGRHAGIISNSELLKVLGQFSLKLNATLLVLPKLKQTTKSKSRNKPTTDSVQNHRVRIAVHGSRNDKEAIGRLLADAGLFLQHPSAAEVLPELEYDNPHYLLRPGAKMPRVEDLALDLDEEIPSQNELEDETRSSMLLRIFEAAGADGSASGVFKATPSPRLRSALMSHQMTSLAFMLEKESGLVEEPKFTPLWTREPAGADHTMRYRHTVTRSLEPRPYPVMGGVLADDMGLGKTMSVLALICSSLDFHATSKASEHSVNQNPKRTLIVTPKSTINSWDHQVSQHVHEGALRVERYHGSGREKVSRDVLDVDIVITTYETLRAEFAASKRSPLYSWQWLRVVLDEAHHIRNRSSQIFTSVCQLKARYRWCLTGTPVHNSLDDYGALLSFIRVYPFQAKSQFMAYIAKPVEEKEELGIWRLQELVRATCLRRTKQKRLASGAFNLPHRSERIELVHLHPNDQELYESVKMRSQKNAAGLGKPLRAGSSAKEKQDNVMVLLNSLRLICNHGKELVPHPVQDNKEYKAISKPARDQWQIYSSTCSSCGGETSGSRGFTETAVSLCADCAALETTSSGPQPRSEPEARQRSPPHSATSMKQYSLVRPVRPSAKVAALIKNLRHESSISDHKQKPRKSVVFSYWVKMLDLIEQAIRAEMIECQRIDGNTSLEARRRAVSEFSTNPDCTVMLASIGSAAEGIDLTAAGIVHLIEPHWNPMVEAQAVDRVYRIGQAQEVAIIRYIVPDSVETYVQAVQQEKMHIINQANRTNDWRDSDLTLVRKQVLEKILS